MARGFGRRVRGRDMIYKMGSQGRNRGENWCWIIKHRVLHHWRLSYTVYIRFGNCNWVALLQTYDVIRNRYIQLTLLQMCLISTFCSLSPRISHCGTILCFSYLPGVKEDSVRLAHCISMLLFAPCSLPFTITKGSLSRSHK